MKKPKIQQTINYIFFTFTVYAWNLVDLLAPLYSIFTTVLEYS